MNGPVLNFLGHTKLELGPASSPGEGHWRLARGPADIAWLVLDQKDSGANTLSTEVLTELSGKLDGLQQDLPAAVVIRSAKPGGFVAGADIREFTGVTDASDIAGKLKQGHGVLDRLEKMRCPVIAVVHGFALGGGLELALACDYRIAIDGAHFGFPEVRLGLHPGLGGTFRMPRLIDSVEAMTMMLTGRNAYTKKARALGIVDAIVEERHVGAAVRAFAAKGKANHGKGLKGYAFRLKPARSYAAGQMRKQTQAKAPKEHYPAPHALIDIWEEHGGDTDAMQQAEIDSFARLLVSPAAQNLVRLFFLREKLKSIGKGEHNVRHVHVVGGGTMGAEIAGWCALQGFTVTLEDIDTKPLGRAVKSAAGLAKDKHLSDIDKRDVLDRLMPDPNGYGVRRADLVIEAVPEKRELKEKILSGIEQKLRPGAILATNTSSIKPDELASALKEPRRFGGLHFFNPVSKLDLVEIVSHTGAGEETMRRLAAFTGAISKLPVPVKAWPGFLVNRALTPYLLEAALMVHEGVSKHAIDDAAKKFGMPMGPLEVADRVGLDICLHVAETLKDGLSKPVPDVPEQMRRMVEEGKLGQKTGEGFYVWKDGKPDTSGKGEDSAPPPELPDRLILPMLDACVECLREGVVENADLVDGAMVFATGFAPFRGGPMHYARARGVADIVSALEKLEARHGARFKPDPGWQDIG